MKTRLGFVSNSSSSSFILRKSALTHQQQGIVRDFFKSRDDWYETQLEEECRHYFQGDLEAHNAADEDPDTASVMFIEMMDDFGVISKDFCIKYEDYVGPEDLR